MMNKETHLDFLIEGPLACFRRPEMAVNLVSYDVITPHLAARLLEISNPVINHSWVVDRIVALNPIILEWHDLDGYDGVHKRIHALRNVRYCISARLVDQNTGSNFVFQIDDLRQRLSAPRKVYLGLRELMGQLSICPPNYDVEKQAAAACPGVRELGWLLLNIYTKSWAKSEFFRATMRDGIIDLSDRGNLIVAS